MTELDPSADTPAVTAASDDGTPDAAEKNAGGARCRTCSTPLSDGQEWCLECGAARTPNRWRSGRRSLLLTTGITISLLGVAAAASYAAIVDEPPITATATVPGAATVVAAVPTSTAPAEVAPETTSSDTLSSLDNSGGSAAIDPGSTPSAADTPTDSGGFPTGGGSTDSGSATNDPVVTPQAETDKQKAADKAAAKKKAKAEKKAKAKKDLQARLIEPESAKVYDPQGTAASASATTSSISGATKDSGLLVRLPKSVTVTRADFSTSTPGFDVTVYGAYLGSSDQVPDSIESSIWSDLASESDVSSPTSIRQSVDDSKYNHVLLWITKTSGGNSASLKNLKLYR